jgi:2-keto-4-pentenoate hydratase/2-oxohepta-3-ene-1,7-dioic acid hydratase in catechol pathway
VKLVTFRRRTDPAPTERLGALQGDTVIELAGADEFPRSMLALLQAGPAALEPVREAIGRAAPDRGYARDAVTLLAPLPRPGKILGVGRNYGAHAAEGGLGTQEIPKIFAKFSSSVIGPDTPIRKPAKVEKLDYETELAVVIGRPARDVSEGEALSFVAGYSLLNDVSAREFQFDLGPAQTSFAKGMDGFCPFGPCLATPDEFADPGDIALRGWVNGELVQDGRTRDMIFSVPRLIAYLSGFLTLEPGDVIATGTPSGVGVFRKPPRFLKPGDVIRLECPEIGVLENRVV